MNKIQALKTLAIILIILSDSYIFLFVKPSCQDSDGAFLFRAAAVTLFQLVMIIFIIKTNTLKRLLISLVESRRLPTKSAEYKINDIYYRLLTIFTLIVYIFISIVIFYFVIKGTYVAGGEEQCI